MGGGKEAADRNGGKMQGSWSQTSRLILNIKKGKSKYAILSNDL